MSEKRNLLLNLPPTFFAHEDLRNEFNGLRELSVVRTRSHDTLDAIRSDLTWADAVIMWSWPDFSSGFLREVGGLSFVGQLNASRQTAESCLELGIPLSEARHCWSPAVAEYALALMLNGLRRVSDFHAAMRAGNESWVRAFPADVDPRERELTGACVGLIGFGAIGRRLAELLEPFRVDLRVHDPFVPADVIAAKGGRKVALEELLAESTITVCCAANAAANTHMIDQAQLERLKPGAILINVARSMLFDTPALIERARRGDITLILDVFDREPLEADSVLRDLPNVYCSPHRAGGILASVRRGIRMLTDDYRSHRAGRPLAHLVDREMLVSLA